MLEKDLINVENVGNSLRNKLPYCTPQNSQ
jgi:hypothetical protein